MIFTRTVHRIDSRSCTMSQLDKYFYLFNINT